MLWVAGLIAPSVTFRSRSRSPDMSLKVQERENFQKLILCTSTLVVAENVYGCSKLWDQLDLAFTPNDTNKCHFLECHPHHFAGNANWAEPSPLFAHRAHPSPLNCKNEYLAVVGSIVWAFCRFKKPRCREMSARSSALHSVRSQFSNSPPSGSVKFPSLRTLADHLAFSILYAISYAVAMRPCCM